MMRRSFILTALFVAMLTFPTGAEEKKTAKQSPKTISAQEQFDRLKKLRGTWVGQGFHENGEQNGVTIRYKLTAQDSTLVEFLFEGTPHEMITMYHLDGDRLLLTHYCAAKNQPRMKAERSKDENTIQFQFLDGTNMDPTMDMHMHGVTFDLSSDDRFRAEWQLWTGGNPAGVSKFDMKRKQD